MGQNYIMDIIVKWFGSHLRVSFKRNSLRFVCNKMQGIA
jgi:hypothetical protein